MEINFIDSYSVVTVTHIKRLIFSIEISDTWEEEGSIKYVDFGDAKSIEEKLIKFSKETDWENASELIDNSIGYTIGSSLGEPRNTFEKMQEASAKAIKDFLDQVESSLK